MLVEKEKFSDDALKCQCLSACAVMTADCSMFLVQQRKMNVLQTSDACAAVRIVDRWQNAAYSWLYSLSTNNIQTVVDTSIIINIKGTSVDTIYCHW